MGLADLPHGLSFRPLNGAGPAARVDPKTGGPDLAARFSIGSSSIEAFGYDRQRMKTGILLARVFHPAELDQFEGNMVGSGDIGVIDDATGLPVIHADLRYMGQVL